MTSPKDLEKLACEICAQCDSWSNDCVERGQLEECCSNAVEVLKNYRPISDIKEAIPERLEFEEFKTSADDWANEKTNYGNLRAVQGYNQAIDDFLTALGIEDGDGTYDLVEEKLDEIRHGNQSKGDE